jgi:tetratricopeptide (TPR) repeat protein
VTKVMTSAIGAMAVLGAIALPGAAVAQAIQVFGGGYGESCWRAALASTFVHMDSAVEEAHWKAASIVTCDDALATGSLDRRDTAATYINRGILEMSRERYDVAEKNFDSALTLLPKLPEAHVDLGSTLINMKKYDEGVKETELGIRLGTHEPERAWYNLGIAYERQGDIQKAYESYRQASILNPKWEEPKEEMARFTVEPAKK